MIEHEDEHFLALACIPVKDFPDGLPDVPLAVASPCPYCDSLMWVGPKKMEMLIAKKDDIDYFFGCYECLPKHVDMDEFGQFNILQYPGS